MPESAAQLEHHARELDRLAGQVDKVCARAERRIDDELAQATQRAEDADAQATQRINELERRRRDAAEARARRRDEIAARAAAGDGSVDGSAAIVRSIGARPELGAIDRVRAWFKAWHQRRRYRGMLRRLDRGLARGEVRVADQRSAALLAVLTERIARLSTTTARPSELDETIAIAQHLSEQYAAYVARLVAARDAAGATPALRDKATAELARCEASARRIDDAIAQLRGLARRRARPR
jgi:hypothetical protein